MIMKELPKIVLKSGKDQSLRRYHPWVFSGAIKKIYGQPADGGWVEVYDNKDEKLATGHYQEGSIAVRAFAFGAETITENFWHQRIQQAWDLRRRFGPALRDDTNIFRLVNAEGDGLPGFIADYYGGALVLQMHSTGIQRHLAEITDALKQLEGLPVDTIYNKSAHTLPGKVREEFTNHYLMGDRPEGEGMEYGTRFHINWEKGQKTGFFIDQRENRSLLESYARDRRVLNMFCFSGGFSVYALRGGADRVDSVDSSAHAMDLTEKNIARNFEDTSRHHSITADAFTFLEEMNDPYDLVILDPPAFAKHHKVVSNAVQGYKRLNQKALEKIRPGGILFTFSCSQAVSRENFKKSLFAASANAGRKVRILHQLYQPADHPVSIYHPEGEYLKGFVLQVE